MDTDRDPYKLYPGDKGYEPDYPDGWAHPHLDVELGPEFEPGERMKLSQSMPQTEEQVGAMVLCMAVSGFFMGLLGWLIGDPLGSTVHTPFSHYMIIGLFVSAFLFLMNVPPISRLPAFVQFLFCYAAMVFNFHISGELRPHSGYNAVSVLVMVFIPIIPGLCLYCWGRVNWWFLWQNASNRTMFERVVSSVFLTAIFPLGIGMGFARFCGMGVEPMTTQVVEYRGGAVIETIPDNYELQQHKMLMATIRRTVGPSVPATQMTAGDL